ncbi:MAG: sigma-70 family RNA polymerase sigma factor [Anaerolineales bacterium]
MHEAERSMVRRAQQGDVDAFAALYRQYYDAIYTFLYYRTRDRALAEDLTADVFVRMIEKIATFRDTGRPFLAWLYTLARNHWVDATRRLKRAPEWAPLAHELQTPAHHAPEVQAGRQLQAECIHRLLPHLTPEQQQVIALKFLQGYGNEEVAAALGKPVGAVKSLQHRALTTLKRLLEEEPC